MRMKLPLGLEVSLDGSKDARKDDFMKGRGVGDEGSLGVCWWKITQ